MEDLGRSVLEEDEPAWLPAWWSDCINLKKYQEREKELEMQKIQSLTKQQFVDKTCAEVLLSNPKMNKRELEAKASLIYKLKIQPNTAYSV